MVVILIVGILFAVHLSANTKPVSTDGTADHVSESGADEFASVATMGQPTDSQSAEDPTDVPAHEVPEETSATQMTDPTENGDNDPTEQPEGEEDSTQSTEEAATEPTKPEYDLNAGAMPIMPLP